MNTDKKEDTINTDGLVRKQDRGVNLNGENKKTNDKEVGSNETEVKNANAAGLGALGRNDEKLTENNSKGVGSAGDY